jgi:hypothetical protein
MCHPIEPQALVAPLEALGRQTGLQFIFVSAVADAQRSKAAPLREAQIAPRS